MNKNQIIKTMKDFVNNLIIQRENQTSPLSYLILDKKIEASQDLIAYVEEHLDEPKTENSKKEGK